MEDNVLHFSENLIEKINDCMNNSDRFHLFYNADENFKRQIIAEVLNIYRKYSLEPTNEMISSIVKRLLLLMSNGIYGIENAVKARDGKINYLKKSISPVYGVEFASKHRVVLFEFYDKYYSYGEYRDNKNKPVIVSLDLERGRLFIQKRTYRSERGTRTEMSINTYCLPSAAEVGQKLKRFAEDRTYGDSIDKLFICDSFHPGRMDDYVHDNLIHKLDISKEEKKLLEEIIHKKAPEPHFHIYSDMIASNLDENEKSLAININDLSVYLNKMIKNAEYIGIEFLTPEIIEKLKNNKMLYPDILKYDLFMPYLSILRGEIEYKSDGMIEKIKQLLSDYNSRQTSRISSITVIYELLSNIKTGSSQGHGGITGLDGLRAIARDIEVLARIMDKLPKELQMSIHEIYTKNFKINAEYFSKKAAELGIELPLEMIMPIPATAFVPADADENSSENSKRIPKTNGNF